MKILSTDISEKPVELSKLFPGDAFLWGGYLCTYFNKNTQYISSVGEKLHLQADTMVHTLSSEISIDHVRSWIRKAKQSNPEDFHKNVSYEELQQLTKEENLKATKNQ